jgi:hypothetical protein
VPCWSYADRKRACSIGAVATMRDLDTLALALPDVTKEVEDGRPTYSVNGKMFCFHRKPRKDAPFDDVLVIRVDGQDAKELTLADPRGIFFTTPHSKAELRELVIEAWVTRAPERVARAWLADNDA